MDGNPADLVRSGYNALSRYYRGDDDPAHEYDGWLADLQDRLPAAGRILDIGCGCGVPVARHLTSAGYQVTGVDISGVQIERARQLVPAASFILADATELDFPAGSWPSPGRMRGQAPRTTGSADPRPCGGVTPTPVPTGPGSARPAWRSPASSSFPKATAATRCSGHARPEPPDKAGSRQIRRMLSGRRKENRPWGEACARISRMSLSKSSRRSPKRCGAVEEDENTPATTSSVVRSMIR